jgi:hypothetical protein
MSTHVNAAFTAVEMLPALGQYLYVKFESITVLSQVINVKQSYGRIRVEIAPVNGEGHQWIEMSRVSSVMSNDLAAKRGLPVVR